MRHFISVIACGLGAAMSSGCAPSGTGDSAPPSPTATAPGDAEQALPDTGTATATQPPESQETPPAAAPPASAVDEPVPFERLAQALQERNPDFDGTINTQPLTPELLQLSISSPAVKDIGPLRRQRIGVLDLSGCDVTDLSPLEGMPLMAIYLEGNQRLVSIASLRGMPLREVYLSNTQVENLAPLRGAPLDKVNLVRTQVRDLSPLTESPITMLWLTDSPVRDLKPLAQVPLVSLTLENCPVEDLSPLAGHPLQRLHIAGTQVTDLSPLAETQLSRLVFTPERIQKGLDAVRQMASLSELGTQFGDAGNDCVPPAVFWEQYGQGKPE